MSPARLPRIVCGIIKSINNVDNNPDAILIDCKR